MSNKIVQMSITDHIRFYNHINIRCQNLFLINPMVKIHQVQLFECTCSF
jgi:hypothetical protein